MSRSSECFQKVTFPSDCLHLVPHLNVQKDLMQFLQYYAELNGLAEGLSVRISM